MIGAQATDVEGVIAYYGNVTDNYNAYADGTFGWHYGIWERGVTTNAEALINSNRRLARGLELGPGARVLDIGCGVGGFATWVAAERGCHVVGITLVEEHVEEARRLARARGVADRCSFRVMDMNALDVAPASFDLITNQESLVHTADKQGFFRQALQALIPGGRWRAVDMSIREGSLSHEELLLHRVACESWSMAPLISASETREHATAAGLAAFTVEDVTPLTIPSARRILEFCRVADRHLASVSPEKRRRVPALAAMHRHVAGGRAYSEGLIRGVFRHNVFDARRPR